MKLKYIISITCFVISLQLVAQKRDKLAALRTSKKIVSVLNLPTHPDYAIQIIALQYPAEEPGFFNNIDQAREFSCTDGYTRYTVGSYSTFQEAAADLSSFKDLGYSQAFVVNVARFNINNAAKGFIPDPNKTYTIQLSAFRFPVYLSFFKGVDDVMEFYLKDKIYRYTVGRYKYEEAVKALPAIKALGYKNAYVTELDAYMPYKIE